MPPNYRKLEALISPEGHDIAYAKQNGFFSILDGILFHEKCVLTGISWMQIIAE
jgi:hypothetical protein